MEVAALLEETPGAVEAGPDGAAIGMVLTGGYEPRPEVLDGIREAGIFAALVDEDTYTVASEVHDLLVKTHAADTEKIELIKALVWEFLHMDRFLEPRPRPLRLRRARSSGRPVCAVGRVVVAAQRADRRRGDDDAPALGLERAVAG